MTDYSIVEFLLISTNVLAMLGLARYCYFDIIRRSMFIGLVGFYMLLKFHDLQGIYPPYLWMTFNLCQAAVFFYLLRYVKIIKDLFTT